MVLCKRCKERPAVGNSGLCINCFYELEEEKQKKEKEVVK